MFFGMNFGNFFGDCLETEYYVSKDADMPDDRTFTWTPLNTTGVVYHVMVDAREWSIEIVASLIFPANLGARDHIEVIETAEENRNEDVTDFASSASNTVELTWDDATDAVQYDIYRHTSAGAIANGTRIAQVTDDGSATFTFLDQGDTGMGLADATYYWAVQAVDAANLTVNSNEINLTVNAAPEPPSNLTVTIAGGNATLSWTASTSADKSGYKIYKSSAVDQPVDLNTVYATEPTTSYVDPVTETGTLQWLVRAYDSAANIEANIRELVRSELSSGAGILPPNMPYNGSAMPVGSGSVEVRVWYSKEGELAVATQIRVYHNDGAGGGINYAAYDSVALAGEFEEEAVVTVSALTGGLTYLFAARAYTAGAVPSETLTGMSATVDVTAPGSFTLSGEVV